MKRKCCLCTTNPATLPDRDRYPDRRIRVCVECHAERLRGDARELLRQNGGRL